MVQQEPLLTVSAAAAASAAAGDATQQARIEPSRGQPKSSDEGAGHQS
jgi:hypothetical protein